MKTIVKWVIIGFLVFYVVTRPVAAAHAANTGIAGVFTGFGGIGDFLANIHF